MQYDASKERERVVAVSPGTYFHPDGNEEAFDFGEPFGFADEIAAFNEDGRPVWKVCHECGGRLEDNGDCRGTYADAPCLPADIVADNIAAEIDRCYWDNYPDDFHLGCSRRDDFWDDFVFYDEAPGLDDCVVELMEYLDSLEPSDESSRPTPDLKQIRAAKRFKRRRDGALKRKAQWARVAANDPILRKLEKYVLLEQIEPDMDVALDIQESFDTRAPAYPWDIHSALGKSRSWTPRWTRSQRRNWSLDTPHWDEPRFERPDDGMYYGDTLLDFLWESANGIPPYDDPELGYW